MQPSFVLFIFYLYKITSLSVHTTVITYQQFNIYFFHYVLFCFVSYDSIFYIYNIYQHQVTSIFHSFLWIIYTCCGGGPINYYINLSRCKFISCFSQREPLDFNGDSLPLADLKIFFSIPMDCCTHLRLITPTWLSCHRNLFCLCKNSRCHWYVCLANESYLIYCDYYTSIFYLEVMHAEHLKKYFMLYIFVLQLFGVFLSVNI